MKGKPSHSVAQKSLGDREVAQNVAARALEKVTSYQHFCRAHQVAPGTTFDALPLTDKSSYLLNSPYVDLLADNASEAFTVFASSGSSGQIFYWPQLREQHRGSVQALKSFLESEFRIGECRTLVIVGLALGSWIGGDYVSWLLKSVAMECKYPCTIFSPGSNHSEIIEMACQAAELFEQIVVVVCPSAIGHIALRAKMNAKDLPHKKLRYLVLGEPFPESIRDEIRRRAGVGDAEAPILSVYGSADTGTLGVESRVSVALRSLLDSNKELRQRFQIGSPVPHFFHFIASNTYIETVAGELVVTRWQGIPLIRYNLHDAATLIRWRSIRQAILQNADAISGATELVEIIRHAGDDLPDLIAVQGRADRGVIVCGTNISETMLDSAIRSPELKAIVTGVYQVKLIFESGRQLLHFDLELLPDMQKSDHISDEIYFSLMRALGRVQPEFQDDWERVYSVWDNDRAHRILRLNLVHYPTLSTSSASHIKHRGLIK